MEETEGKKFYCDPEPELMDGCDNWNIASTKSKRKKKKKPLPPPFKPVIIRREGWAELEDELCELKRSLKDGRERRVELSNQLDETRRQLPLEKTTFFNKIKEMQDKLDKLKRASNLNNRVAATVHRFAETKTTKELEIDFQNLKETVMSSQQKFSAELQDKKNKTAALELELQRLRASHLSNLSSLQKESSTLQDEMRELKMASSTSLQTFRAQIQLEKDQNEALQQKVTEFEEKTNAEKEQLESELGEQICANKELEMKLQAEQEVSQGLRAELNQLRKEHQDRQLEVLEKKVQELNAQLQRAETISCCKKDKLKQLTTELEGHLVQTEALKVEVDYLKTVLQETTSSSNQPEKRKASWSWIQSLLKRARARFCC